MVVTPDHVVDGQTVHVELSGFPADVGAIIECPASVVGSGQNPFGVCPFLHISLPGGQSADVVVHSVFTAGNQTVNCHRAPGCVVGYSNANLTASAYAPITFGPDILATPRQRNLTDGQTVQVIGGDIPATGDWSVAQCGKAYLDDPTPAQAAALCSPSVPVTPDADHASATDLVVRDPLTSSGGATVPCGYTGCVAVLSQAGQPPVSDISLSFGPLAFTVTPSTGIIDGSDVEVTVDGSPIDDLYTNQCRMPVGATRDVSQCTDTTYKLNLDRWGSGRTTMPIKVTVQSTDDCRTGPCAVVLSDNGGTFVGDPAPITLAPAPVVTFQPTSSLLDGQAIAVTGQYLRPGDYTLFHCKDVQCDADGTQPVVTVGSDGVLDATVPAVQRFTSSDGQYQYCRADECEVVLNALRSGLAGRSAYGLSAGALTVTPSTGLSDGQTVQVAGSGLMASYDGPTLWVFPTGGWALTECDAAVLDDLSLGNVFRQCSVPPPTRGVTIAGSTLDTPVQVKATIIKLLGGTTDCRTASGTCVVGLVRFEQDGSISAHLRPVDFS